MKDYFHQLFHHATTLHQQGDMKGAQAAYRQVLKDFKQHPDALHLLGLTYAQQGAFDRAIDYIQQAIQSKSDIPAFHSNLAEAYVRSGALEQALTAYEESTRLDARFAQGYFGQANVYKKQGAWDQAKRLYQKTVEVNPQFFQAYYNWGNTEQEMGNYKTAMSCYEKCLAIKDEHELAHNNMAIMLQHWDRDEEAIAHYLKAIEVNPNFKSAYSNLTKMYEKHADIDNARKYYQSLLSLAPDDEIVEVASQTVSPVIFESNEAIDQYHQEIHQALDRFNTLPFVPAALTDSCYNIFSDLVYHGRDVLAIKRKYAQKYLPSMPVIPVRQPNDKPHIGFVVTSGHEGVFVKCMRGVINQIDKSRFTVTVICSQPNGRKIIEPTLDSTQQVGFLALSSQFDQASQQILNAKFDVLNYWEIGTDTTNYFLPFLRLAPVQCTSWGWPTTSGIPNVDYFISSKHLETPSSDRFYSEKLIRMDRIPVYYYAPTVPDRLQPLSEYGLSEDHNHYLCAQNLKKVHPDFDEVVKGILEKDPKGIVLFIEDKQSHITHLLKQRLNKTCSMYMGRIQFLSRMQEGDYLGLLKQVDVALDTLHYGGGANTCYDAFVCGTPVVTMAGQMHSSRYAYAAYQQMGLDWATDDLEGYISRAVDIATDAELRSKLSIELKEKSSKVLEDQQAVADLSDFFEQAIKGLVT